MLCTLFACPTLHPGPALQAKESGSQVNVVIDKEDVLHKLGDLLQRQDLSKYVL